MVDLTKKDKSYIKQKCFQFHATAIEYKGVWYRVPESWAAEYATSKESKE